MYLKKAKKNRKYIFKKKMSSKRKFKTRKELVKCTTV